MQGDDSNFICVKIDCYEVFRKILSPQILPKYSSSVKKQNLEASFIRTLRGVFCLFGISRIDQYRAVWLGNVFMALIITLSPYF